MNWCIYSESLLNGPISRNSTWSRHMFAPPLSHTLKVHSLQMTQVYTSLGSCTNKIKIKNKIYAYAYSPGSSCKNKKTQVCGEFNVPFHRLHCVSCFLGAYWDLSRVIGLQAKVNGKHSTLGMLALSCLVTESAIFIIIFIGNRGLVPSGRGREPNT